MCLCIYICIYTCVSNVYIHAYVRMCERGRERVREREKVSEHRLFFFFFFSFPNRPAPDSWYKDNPMLPKCSFNWNSLTRVSLSLSGCVASSELKGVWSLGKRFRSVYKSEKRPCIGDRDTMVYVIYISYLF